MLATNEVADELVKLLGGGVQLNLMELMRTTVAGQQTPDVSLESAAVGIDANVFLRVNRARNGADIIDYLGQQHRGPLIVPLQTLIEFWNNQFTVIDGVAERLRKDFGKLTKTVEGIHPDYSDLRGSADDFIDRFQEDFGHVLDESTEAELKTLFDSLHDAAIVPQVPRTDLLPTAELRNSTKVPPGFRDPGHGDFFVWAEFLAGLREASDDGVEYDRAVFVTNDRKPDWSLQGIAHPYLRAEVEAWVGVPLELWNIDQLSQGVTEVLASEPPGDEDATTPAEVAIAIPPRPAERRAARNPPPP